MTITSDSWLTGLLGYPVFTVAVAPDDQIDASLAQHIAQQTRALYCARIPTHVVALHRRLQQHGFYVVDANATVERRGGIPSAHALAMGVQVRPYAGQEAEVLAIARSCFQHSRFHLDPAFPRAVADAIKFAWVQNYIRGRRGDQLFVAEQGGRVLGFLAAMVIERAGTHIAVSDLLGVAPPYQRLGVGRLLLDAFIAAYHDRCAVLRGGGIYLSNRPALQLHERMGFLITDVTLVLHRHVNATVTVR